MDKDFLAHLERELTSLKDQGLYKAERKIATPQDAVIQTDDGREVLNFCANNYLGLANHPDIVNAALEGVNVGGKSVGAVLGWGNMFGNLGAAAATQIYAFSDKAWGTIGHDGLSNMEGTVYAAMAGFFVSGIAALGIDCAKPLVSEATETSGR